MLKAMQRAFLKFAKFVEKSMLGHFTVTLKTAVLDSVEIQNAENHRGISKPKKMLCFIFYIVIKTE